MEKKSTPSLEVIREDILEISLQNHLKKDGIKCSIVSFERLRDLRSELENKHKSGKLDRALYKNWLTGFNFDPDEGLPEIRSIILTAVSQPVSIVTFQLNGKHIEVKIPPTYLHSTDGLVRYSLNRFVDEHGYVISEADIPVKPLAVHSGLARYGRNNITYVNEWGSYYRLKAYFSNMPCINEKWTEFMLADECKNCSACIKACPTNAISGSRILINAETCLTYFNESIENFPGWLDPQWHNCLIGCLLCQEKCPLNKQVKKNTVPAADFSEQETDLILKGIPRQDLPEDMTGKLKKIWLYDDYVLLKRNLTALINRQ